MKNLALAMMVLLSAACSLAIAHGAPAYETPPGWKEQAGEGGSRLFVPGDLQEGERAFILLFPVVDVAPDRLPGSFEQVVQLTIGKGRLLQATDLKVEDVGPYRVYSRMLSVEEPDGSRTFRMCALQTFQGKGQFGMFATTSEALWKRYAPAVGRFGEHWDFAQVGRAQPKGAQAGTHVDYDALKRILETIQRCLTLQEQTKFAEALKLYEDLQKQLEALPRYPNAAPGTNEAFWEGQMRTNLRQIRLNMMTCLSSTGRFEEAAALARAELAKADKDDWKVRASCYATLGTAHYYLLEYDKAREMLLLARQQLEQRFGEAATRVEGILKTLDGRKPTPEEAKAVEDGFDVFGEARTLNSKIFSLLVQLGLFEEAIDLYTAAPFVRLTRILDHPQFRIALAASMDALGPAFAAEIMKAYDKLIPMERFERTSTLLMAWRLKAADQENPADLAKAESLQHDLEALAATHPDDPFQKTMVLANRGALLLSQKQWAEARTVLQSALDASRAIPQPLYRDSLQQVVLMRQAEALVELGDAAGARAAVEASQRLDVPTDNTLLALFLWTRARVETLNGEDRKALDDFNRCLDMLERERAGVQSAELLKKFYRRRQRMYEDAIHFLQKHNDPRSALDIMERVRARTLRDLLEKTPITKGATKELVARLDAIRDEERRKAVDENRSLVAAGGAVTLRGAMSLPSTGALKTVDEVLAVRPELAELKAGTPPSDVARKTVLDADTVVLAYFVGDQHSAVVVLKGDGTSRIHDLPLTSSRLAAMVADLRASVQDPSSDEWQADAAALHAALLAPLQADFAGRRRLVIVPYGAANSLPWSVLAPKGGRPLVEEHDLVVLPSLSVLEFCRARNTHRLGGGIAFAIGSLSRGGMLPLPGTQAEVRAIAGVMPSVKVEVEEAFTFGNILREGGSSPILHFATHGFVDPAQPERSGILTADGRLYLSEIFRLDLHANLVVLSACETGLGKVYTGDEMVGLTRAFMYAGTPSVVATLWKVSDKATARFMALFYQSLAAGRDKAAALREAQLALREEFPQPLFWAPFTLYGDWR